MLCVRRAHRHQVPRGRAARRTRCGLFDLALRALAGCAWRGAVRLVHHRTRVHRPGNRLPARCADAIAGLDRAYPQRRGSLRPAARGGDRRRGRLSVFVAGLLGLQAPHRQGRHGIRRLQDERRGGSVSGLEDAAARDPAFLAGRPRLRRAANVRGARPLGRRVPLSFRTVSRDRRRGRALLGRSHRAVVRAEAVSFVIGLTGGIGSGKSTAAEEFARLGASVVDSDAIAHELTERGGAALPQLERLFGAEFIAASGAMDRKKMRERVFSDPVAKRALEALLRIAAASGSYVVQVVPLLVESPDYRQRVDRVLVIDAPEETQVARVHARSQLSESEIQAILRSQASRAERLAAADDVIDNSGTLDALRKQVAALHARYEKMTRNVKG